MKPWQQYVFILLLPFVFGLGAFLTVLAVESASFIAEKQRMEYASELRMKEEESRAKLFKDIPPYPSGLLGPNGK